MCKIKATQNLCIPPHLILQIIVVWVLNLVISVFKYFARRTVSLITREDVIRKLPILNAVAKILWSKYIKKKWILVTMIKALTKKKKVAMDGKISAEESRKSKQEQRDGASFEGCVFYASSLFSLTDFCILASSVIIFLYHSPRLLHQIG